MSEKSKTTQHTLTPTLADWRLDTGREGMPRLVLDRGDVFAEVYLNGAHLTAFENRKRGFSMFWMDKAPLAPGRAIRGGVPLVFPWFGPHHEHDHYPRHGFARNLTWSVAGEFRTEQGGVGIALDAVDMDLTRAIWPHAFHARVEVIVEPMAITQRLTIRNTDKAPFTYENALHSYFAVGDVRNIAVEGLDGAEYVDKVDGKKRKRQEGPLRFTGEKDSVFVGVGGACVIREAGRPAIRIEKSGSHETVAWNPWAKKGDPAATPPPFVCVEPANCMDHTVTLAPGQSHTLEARFQFDES